MVSLIAGSCAQHSAPAPAATAAPSWRLPHSVVPAHYKLAITIDLAAATFAGEETIDVSVLEPTPYFVLNAAEIAIQKATVQADGVLQLAQVRLDEQRQTATLVPLKPVGPGSGQITISYTGILNDQLRGLYLSKTNNRRYAVSQLEATDARRMFPGFDEPAFKATFDLSVVIDAGDHAISNGAVISDTPGPAAGKHTVTFSTTPKMSTYLLALVVGDFECESGASDGIPVRVCATPDKKALTSLALHDAEAILHFYNQYFNIKYPYKKLDIVAVPDFAAGAMENTAAIFYRELDLLADEAHASFGTRTNVMNILAHEMAHQWFGDLVTMAWWNDIWLNEGFATWMETKPAKALHPEWHQDLSEVGANIRAMNTDRLVSTRPVSGTADTPDQINEAFDTMAYEKGGAVLRMVESYLGEQAFRTGINAYLANFQYGNAAAEDFFSAMATATGKPVDGMLRSFVMQPGVPLVSAHAECAGESTRVAVTQERYQIPGTAAPAEAWQVPVCARNTGGTGAATCEVVSGASQTLTIPGCGTSTILNANAAGYYRTGYDAATLARITHDLSGVSEPERVLLGNDAWAFVRAGKSDVGTYLDAAGALSADRTSTVLGDVAAVLNLIDEDLTTPADAAAYRAWVVKTFGPALADVGWTPKPGETGDQAALRAALVQIVAGTGRDPAANAQARTLVDRELKKSGAVDATLAGTVIQLAADAGDVALYDAYLARHRSAKSPEDRDRYLFALASFSDPVLMKRTIELALSKDVRTQDTAILLGGVLTGPGGWEHAWPIVRDRWTDVIAHTDPAFGTSNLLGGLGSFCDTGAADELESFFKTHDARGAERTVRQTIEQVRSCAALKTAQSPKLAEWLAKQK